MDFNANLVAVDKHLWQNQYKKITIYIFFLFCHYFLYANLIPKPYDFLV